MRVYTGWFILVLLGPSCDIILETEVRFYVGVSDYGLFPLVE